MNTKLRFDQPKGRDHSGEKKHQKHVQLNILSYF